MAKRKQREPREISTPTGQTEDGAAALALSSAGSDPRFSAKQYIVMNIVFDVFCVAQLAVVYFALKETKGLFYFFGLLMVGFFVVSVFDYMYDRMFSEPAQDD